MNIIVVMSDTFRYDNLSCYGPTACKTPVLDKFAEESSVFDNAYLGSFPTILNRTDIWSGRFCFIDREWGPLAPEIVTPQQILSASGVVTQLIVDNPHMLENGYNFSRGFDAWEWIRGQETDQWKTAPKQVTGPKDKSKYNTREFIVYRHLRNTHWWKGEEDRFAPRSLTSACDWLEENQDQDQFFLWVDLFDPHEPWDAPKKYVDMYDPGYEDEEVTYPNYGFWREHFSEKELNHFRAMYMGESTMVDHWFGVLLDKIDELGLTEDTAVIFLSDHGYLFGEHELTGKSLFPNVDGKMYYEAFPMYDELRRTPLMVRLPGQVEGQRIKALVQAPDLMPTFLEMAGMVATETIGGQAAIQALQCGVFYTEDWEFKPEQVHGKSLMPLLRAETDKLRDIVVCSNTLIHHSPILAKAAIVTEDGWCLHYSGKYDQVATDGRFFVAKLIDPGGARFPCEPELYYLPDDPQEQNNVIDSNESLAQEIHERHVKWLEELGMPEEHLAGRRKLR